MKRSRRLSTVGVMRGGYQEQAADGVCRLILLSMAALPIRRTDGLGGEMQDWLVIV